MLVYNITSHCRIMFNYSRLRHERLKPVRVDRGGPSEYQMLRCYDLDSTPKPDSPRHLIRNHDDPFDFYINNDGDQST